MGAPHTPHDQVDSASLSGATPTAVADRDPLVEIGMILAALNRRDQESEASATRLQEAREGFLEVFHSVCANEVRPAMEAVRDGLRASGGDALLEEHPGGEPRVPTPRLTLWMSLQGPIVGPPRPDRHPYLQLDADVDDRTIRLTQGDIWNGSDAGHSGSAGTWRPEDVTRASVIRELVSIVRRSANVPIA